mgnify:CR=1 FL=1
MSTKGISANRLELLQIADAVAREKSIDKAIVISAMEEAIQKAAASRYGIENNIKAEINTETGSITLMRLLEIVEKVEDFSTQINIEDAKLKNPDATLGGEPIEEELPPIDFGRVAAQSAKQVIFQKVVFLKLFRGILSNFFFEFLHSMQRLIWQLVVQTYQYPKT